MAFPKLERPPINEVICGFIFDPAPVDALDFGVYHQERAVDFPSKEMHPALVDEASITFGAVPYRAWFISPPPGTVLLQLQHDRFYVNWRAKGDDYPRFNDRDGITGLKRLALAEWDRFVGFLTLRANGAPPRLRRVELAKVDVLERGTCWVDHADLCQLMPVASVFQRIQLNELSNLQLRLTEKDGADKATLVTVNVTETQARIEARVILQSAEDIDGLLTLANERLNYAFFGLLDDEEMLKRFGGSR